MVKRVFQAMLVIALLEASVLAQPTQTAVQRILLEPTLWGPDLALLLQELQNLRQAGETTAYVFADHLTGAAAFETRQAAQNTVSQMGGRIARPAPLRPPFQAARTQAASQSLGTIRVSAEQLIDGDGFHLSFTRAPELRLLSPGLTVQAVEARLGPAERVTHKTIQNRGERKPVILTLREYAGGAIAFAESNMSDPNIVERVVLNLATVVPVVVPQ